MRECPRCERCYEDDALLCPEDQAKTKIESMGYKIDKFKIDGNCYEIYGINKEGRKAEVYFDAKTLGIIKSEIRK